MQLPLPVSQVGFAMCVVELFSFVANVVSVAGLYGREDRGVTLSFCLVKRCQFFIKLGQRPAVGDDVMHANQQNCGLLRTAEEFEADERSFA